MPAFLSSIRLYTTPLVFLYILISGYMVQDILPYWQGQVAGIFLAIFLVQILGTLANDFRHQAKDKVAGRNRNTHQLLQSYQTLLKITVVLLVVVIITIGIVSGVGASALIVALILFTFIYGELKSWGLWSVLFRGLASGTLALMLPSIAGIFDTTTLIYLAFVILLDGTGNLVGDIRDYPLDHQAHVRTAIVRHSFKQIAILLIFLNVGILSWLCWQLMPAFPLQLLSFFSLFIISYLPLTLPILYTHFAYLIGKYLLLFLLLYHLSQNILLILILALVTLPLVWFTYRHKHFQPNAHPFQYVNYAIAFVRIGNKKPRVETRG